MFRQTLEFRSIGCQAFASVVHLLVKQPKNLREGNFSVEIRIRSKKVGRFNGNVNKE